MIVRFTNEIVRKAYKKVTQNLVRGNLLILEELWRILGKFYGVAVNLAVGSVSVYALFYMLCRSIMYDVPIF